MRCIACGADNPGGAKFCMECGTPASAGCTTCGADLPDGAKFCMECGTPVVSADSPPAAAPPVDSGERRLVSVLFADLVGFTPYTETRDSEDVRSMLTAYFDRAAGVIERFGGLVEKYIGDAIMAVWGAEAAEEDDAERAVRAALEILSEVTALGEELGAPELDARVGVLTGEATVGGGGNQSTGMIVGDVVNTAARLQSIAHPGTVLVGETTKGLTEASIEYAAAGQATLKGKAAPVPTFRAARVVASRRGEGKKGGIEPPFVGRDREFRLLKEVLHSADTGLQLVSVVGEPGIGKSRLAEELFKYIDGLADTYYWHAGRCPAYGDGVTFWALAEMVRQRARIAETDTPEKSLMLLRTMLTEYVPDAEDRMWLEPRLAGLLGIASMPTTDRSDLFAAWRTLFQRMSERSPTVMVFEDLHWADEGLLDFIDNLATTASRSPIVVVTLARPDLLERRPTWGTGHRQAMGMRLSPLTEEAMHQLIEGAAPQLEVATRSSIVERAGGVPLFAVEFIRMAASGQAFDAEALPDSLQAMVGSRIDRLEPDLRSLVLDAAVLGMSFTLQGLEALRSESAEELEPLMAQLVAADLFELDHDPRSPERGQYRFVQSVIKEVAHGRLSRRDRIDRHLAVARYLEGLHEPSLAAVIASHYLDAHRAAGVDEQAEISAAALTSLDTASARAAALHSHQQVVSLFDSTRELLSGSELLRFMDRATRSAGAYDDNLYLDMATQAVEMANEWGTPEEVLRAATLSARSLNDVHRVEEGRDALIDLVPTISNDADSIAVYAIAELARSHSLLGETDEALALSNRAMRAGEKLGLTEVVADVFTTAGTAAIMASRPLYGRAMLKAGADLSVDNDHWSVAWRALNNLISVEGTFDMRRATAIAEEAALNAARMGEMRQAIVAASWLATNGCEIGEPQRIEAVFDLIDPDSLSEQDRSRLEHWQATLAASLGRAGYVEPAAPTGRGALRDTATARAVGNFLRGDFERTIEIARMGSDLWGFSIGTLTWFYSSAEAALMADDIELLQEIYDTHGDDFPRATGPAGLAADLVIKAMLAAGRGEPPEAVVEILDEAASAGTHGGTLLLVAKAIGSIAQRIGTDAPGIARHAADAARFFNESGLAGYFDVFTVLRDESLAEESA